MNAPTPTPTLTPNRNLNLHRPGLALNAEIKSKSKRLAAIICLVLAGWAAVAQDGLQNMVFTAGTTHQDTEGRYWAYLIWQGSSPILLRGHAFAVYAKRGDANSAAAYERKAIVALQTDPLVIDPLLKRSVHFGADLLRLETNIVALFDKLIPPHTLGVGTLAEKLSTVILGAQDDPAQYENLILLARLHPGVSFCLGLAHAELIAAGATVTFEIRDFNLAKNEDIAVLGRVTVTGGPPVALPAPARPVQVHEYPRRTSAKGDLNVKLRWATTPELRGLSLMSYGFNLYRMTQAFAEARNFDDVRPDTGELLRLASSDPNVKRINHLPILAEKDFYPGACAGCAEDFVTASADLTTFFTHDDNERHEPDGVPFRSGDRFYYFVTARDILGRDGAVSPGTLVTLCDRLPPPAPRQVKVENDYAYVDGAQQHLKVSWDQNDNGGVEQTVEYYVYRWTSITQMHGLAGNPEANRIARVNHSAKAARNSYVDNGPGSPTAPADYGKTFWYTVRAVDQGVEGACEQNVSANSGPVFGVLRDRIGPGAAPSSSVEVLCVCPTNWFSNCTHLPGTALHPDRYYFHLVNERRSEEISWAEFSVMLADGLHSLGRIDFPDRLNTVARDYTLPRSYVGPLPRFLCRVGLASGKTSNVAMVEVGSLCQPPSTNTVLGLFFQSDVNLVRTRPEDCDGAGHRCPPRGGCQDVPELCAEAPATAREYRFYRRVDDGPLMLIGQGETSPGEINCISPEAGLPANAATICDYVQFLDEHGNAGPMERIGDCYTLEGRTPLPKPMLARIHSAGSAENPQMVLRWFCPPYGLERFRISIAAGRSAAPIVIGATPPLVALALDEIDVNIAVEEGEEEIPFTVRQYRTPRIGPSFGESAEFTVTINIQADQQYTVFIDAVEKGTGRIDDGKRSNVEQFTWRPLMILVGGDGQPLVPWPSRSLPPIDPNLVPPNEDGRGITARMFMPPEPYTGVGVRIGEMNFPFYYDERSDPTRYQTPDRRNPVESLYPKARGEALLPVALYRFQVPSTKFPTVSGDVVQVSPLMEQIAYELPGAGNAVIHDPFIAVISEPGAGGGGGTTPMNNPLKGIYLLDTQPVIRGAAYKYLLVRFHADGETGSPPGEIEAVIPTNVVEVR